MEVVFLAVALSADAVVFGLSFGVKDIKIPFPNDSCRFFDSRWWFTFRRNYV